MHRINTDQISAKIRSNSYNPTSYSRETKSISASGNASFELRIYDKMYTDLIAQMAAHLIFNILTH